LEWSSFLLLIGLNLVTTLGCLEINPTCNKLIGLLARKNIKKKKKKKIIGLFRHRTAQNGKMELYKNEYETLELVE
jgi:hypothetical protein